MGIVSSLTSSSAPTGLSLANITNVANQYIVAPIAAFGMAGFVFNAEGEAAADLTADITDHYTEDNQAVQDQIALHPKKVILKGYVGELVYNASGSAPGTIQTLAEKLTAITAFLPSLTAAATQAQQALINPASITLNNALSTTSNIYALIQNILGATGNQKNQQNAYNFFKALWQSKTLMSIQTPWEFMTNMAIENVRPIQSENSIYMTDFAVTYKEIRIASTSTVAFSQLGAGTNTGAPTAANQQVLQGVAAIQAAPPAQIGNISGAIPSSSLVSANGFNPTLFTGN